MEGILMPHAGVSPTSATAAHSFWAAAGAGRKLPVAPVASAAGRYLRTIRQMQAKLFCMRVVYPWAWKLEDTWESFVSHPWIVAEAGCATSRLTAFNSQMSLTYRCLLEAPEPVSRRGRPAAQSLAVGRADRGAEH
eukprot:s393_g27.t1